MAVCDSLREFWPLGLLLTTVRILIHLSSNCGCFFILIHVVHGYVYCFERVPRCSLRHTPFQVERGSRHFRSQHALVPTEVELTKVCITSPPNSRTWNHSGGTLQHFSGCHRLLLTLPCIHAGSVRPAPDANTQSGHLASTAVETGGNWPAISVSQLARLLLLLLLPPVPPAPSLYTPH